MQAQRIQAFPAPIAPAPIVVPPTEFPPQTEDYAEARKKFQTNLILKMASPQPPIPMQLPPEAEEIEYGSGELHLKAWVSRDSADGKEKKPAVMFLHNGLAFGNEDWDQSKPFRDADFVVMMPMLRGENGQEGNYSLFYDEVEDVLAAADALEKLPYVDSKRMYLAGHSTGATLTLLTALTTPRFRAAGAFSPFPDLTNLAAVRSNMTGFEGIGMGTVPYDEESEMETRMRSALAFAESFKCPVRIYYGDQETYFKACSEKLVEKAKKKKLDVEAVEVAGAHFSSTAKTGAVNNAIPKCIEFFQKH
jgi:dipeptidyl aminopeptidase/acylaminoacyl peptidase